MLIRNPRYHHCRKLELIDVGQSMMVECMPYRLDVTEAVNNYAEGAKTGMIFFSYLTDFSYLPLEKLPKVARESEQVKNRPI